MSINSLYDQSRNTGTTPRIKRLVTARKNWDARLNFLDAKDHKSRDVDGGIFVPIEKKAKYGDDECVESKKGKARVTRSNARRVDSGRCKSVKWTSM